MNNIKEAQNYNSNDLTLSLGPCKAEKRQFCPVTGASDVFSHSRLSDQLPLPEPCHGEQHCFSLLDHC